MRRPPAQRARGQACPPRCATLAVAAGVNDTFRQAGIAVGVAALGALVPAAAAFGGGSPQSYVDGMNDALWVCAVTCAAGAVACAALIAGRDKTAQPTRELALDAA